MPDPGSRHLLRGACRDDSSSLFSAFRPQVDQVIARGQHVQVVFDQNPRVPLVHQLVEEEKKFPHIRVMQAGGRFVQEVKGRAGEPFGQFGGQLDPLGLAAAQGGRRLPEADVPETRLLDALQFRGDPWNIREEP